MQRDDGALRNGIVTADSLDTDLLGDIVVAVSGDIDDKVQQATAAATDAVNASINSQNSANNSQGYAEQSLASAGTAQANAQASNISKNAAAASEIAAAASAASALASKNDAATSETASAASATSASGSATAAANSAASILDAEANSAASAAAALASEGAAADSALQAANHKNAAADSAADAQASEDAARLFAESLVQPFLLVKADYGSPAFKKTAAGALSIKAGTVVVVNAVAHAYTVDTPITMPPVVTAGSDYSVWVNLDGTAQAVADSLSAPAAAPQAGSKKIGGFHYGLVAAGTTPASGSFNTVAGNFSGLGGTLVWSQAMVDAIAGINQYSIWDLCWRCQGEQFGMALDPQTLTWWGIYFCSQSHDIYGISVYNAVPASGTNWPYIPAAYRGAVARQFYGRLSFYEASEIVASHQLRLPRYEEFVSAALGVTEGQSLGGASVTIPVTTRQPGYTSRIGLEQATGHQWIVGGPGGSVGGSAYEVGPGRGQLLATTGMPLFGGGRGDTANAGSRAANFNGPLFFSGWSVSVRAAGDHMNTWGAAR